MKLTEYEAAQIQILRDLDAQNRPAPWGYGGKPNGRGKQTYNLLPHEEDLVIAMRNNLALMLDLIDKLLKEIRKENL